MAAAAASSWPKLILENDDRRTARWAQREETAGFCAQSMRGCVASNHILQAQRTLTCLLEEHEAEIGRVTRAQRAGIDARADELRMLIARCATVLETQRDVEPARAAFERIVLEATQGMKEAAERRRQQLVAAQRALAETLADGESELTETAEEAHWAAVGRGCARIPRMLAELV